MTEPDHEVPARPAFVLRVRAEPGGGRSAWLDDEAVAVPDGVDIHRALIQEARRRADHVSPGSTVRVTGETPDGSVFHLAIGADGRAWEVPAPPETAPAAPATAPVNAFQPLEHVEEPAPQPAYADDKPVPAEPRSPAAMLTDDLGRPIPTTTTQATAHEHFEPSPTVNEDGTDGSTDRTARSSDEEKARPSRRNLLLAGAGVVVLAGAATAGFLASRGGDSAPQPTPTAAGTDLPDGLRPPAGLPSSYLWTVVNMSDVAPRLAITDKQLICTVDNDTTGGIQLISLNASTGKSQWKADLPIDAVLVDGPALAPVDGATAVVLTSQSQIIAYPLTGGEPKTWPVHRDWSVAITASGVIVTKPDDKHSAFVLHNDKLRRRAIEKGTNPVALLRDGTLVATDAHGRVWLSTHETKVPRPKKLQAPDGSTPGTYVAATRSQIITAFVPKDHPRQSRLRSFALPSLQPRITTEPIDPAVFPSNFMISPDETWAVGGNTWINMRTGDCHVITASWSPIAISRFDSWSKSGDNILTANRAGKSLGPAKGSGGQVLVPRGGTEKVAYCVGSVGSDTTLYAVPVSGA